MDSSRYLANNHRSALRRKSTAYLERLQKVMDAASSAAQNLELRKKFIERQNRMNYRNEYDRLTGDLLKLRPDLIQHSTQNTVIRDFLMPEEKLREIGEYVEPEKPPATAPPESPRRGRPAGSGGIKTPGIKITEVKPPRQPKGKSAKEKKAVGRPRKLK